jgi:uncharacterized membrane protein YgcG
MTDNTDLGAVMLIAIVFTFVAFLLIFVISDAIKTARINREWARKIAKERARQAPMWRSVTTTVNRPVPTPSTSGKTRESGRSETKVATGGPLDPLLDPASPLYMAMHNAAPYNYTVTSVESTPTEPSTPSHSDHGSSSHYDSSPSVDHGSSHSSYDGGSSSFDGGFSDGGGSSGGFD